MKRSSSPRRPPSSLSASLHQRLSPYALAAGAAGVGLLAVAQPSEAEIVYTPADQTIGRNGTYNLDLNHDGITDFTIIERIGHTTFRTSQALWAVPADGNNVKCVTSECISSLTYAAALRAGSRIGGDRGWVPFRAGMAFEELFERGSLGYFWGWVNVTNRYLGLRFEINGETHFGWARLTVEFCKSNPRSWEAHLTGYAYETVPGKSIEAGQITEETDDATGTLPPGDFVPTRPSTSTPAPFASLGALALGANGLALWRREESESLQPKS
jgi:hypothetical protein